MLSQDSNQKYYIITHKTEERSHSGSRKLPSDHIKVYLKLANARRALSGFDKTSWEIVEVDIFPSVVES